MKKILQFLLCALGGILIGLFANRLNNGMGIALFVLGICMLTGSLSMTIDGKKGDR